MDRKISVFKKCIFFSVESCLSFPVKTFASGPTNSMRGAAFLAMSTKTKEEEIQNAIVADIGGTTTDVGQLVKGFPRADSNKVKVSREEIKNGEIKNFIFRLEE